MSVEGTRCGGTGLSLRAELRALAAIIIVVLAILGAFALAQ